MFTVCPKCALTLVVTAADLRIGQGYVRCGRCSNVFNALVGLSEERQAALFAQSAKAVPEPDAGEEVEADALPDSALEFDAESTDVSQVFIEPRPGPHDAASGTFETIVLEADAPEPDEASPGEATPGIDVLAARQDAANDDAEPLQAANDASLEAAPHAAAAFDRARIEAPRPRAEPAATEPCTVPDAAESLVATARSASPRRAQVLWGIATGALVIALAVQVVHRYRDVLAADARFRAPLLAVYDALGIAIAPRWDVTGYDVRQLGASAGAADAGVLTVRASVQNSGANPQPLPLLRVTVQDRFGNRIAARDVTPAAYAARAGADSGLLDVGERVDAEIRLADPGASAVGFELDACLPIEGGRVACANDQRGR